MTQQLDRTDATHAGISRTLARLTTALEEHSAALRDLPAVLRDLRTTLDRWLERQPNGR